MGGRDTFQGVVEAHARADPELGEHIAQVPFDRPRADEELGGDLRIGVAVAREPGDVRLLRRELVARVVAALAHLLPGGRSSRRARSAKAVRAHRGEQLARGAQLLARVDAPALAAQPLAVQQARAGELGREPRAAEALDGLAVEALGGVAVAQQRAQARPMPSAQSVPLACALEPVQGVARVRLAAPGGCLDSSTSDQVAKASS